MNIISGIIDTPRLDQKSPYIQIGTINEINDELLDNTGGEINLTLHIWADETQGKKRVLEIRDLLIAALPTWTLYDGIEILKDTTDSNWWHGIVAIRYYIRRN